MRTRRLPVVLLAGVCTLGLVSCGDDTADQGSTGSLDTLPPVDSGAAFSHPTGADDVVFELAQVGGFVPIEFAFQQTPSILVSGDGRLFRPGAVPAIYPGPLLPAVSVESISEDGIQALLAAADEAGLLTHVDYDARMEIADAPTTRLTINVDGETYVHSADALGLELDEVSPERQALAAFVEQLADLGSVVGVDELGEQTMYEPDSYGIRAMPVGDLSEYGGDGIEPTVVAWPTESGVVLADAADCTIVPADSFGTTFAESNQLTFFDDGGTTYQVLVKFILPGVTCP